MTSLDLIATSGFALEAVVARELAGLGYEGKIVSAGRVLFLADARGLCRANLWLRAAGRVLLRVGTFEATDFGQLFDQTYALPWERWLGPDAAFPVNGRSIKSHLSSVPACQKIVKKAIVEKLKAAHHAEGLPETGPTYTIEVAILNDQVTLTIDTSGSGLHKRGYRTLTGKAPLRETLAAALILISRWQPERPLIDPFCGSGTIPIEAAMIAQNIAPGLARSFAADSWPTLDGDAAAAPLWANSREEARDLDRPDVSPHIIGTDSDETALSLARYHAKRAGLEEQVHFQNRPFAELSSKRQYGSVICNPPYGERMSDRAEVDALYRSMPLVLRRLKTWSHFILATHSDFERIVGRKADRRRKLYNGPIECTYYQFFGPKPPRPRTPSDMPVETEPVETEPVETEPDTEPELRVEPTKRRPAPAEQAFGGLSEKALEQAELFRSRLTKRARHLRRWPTKHGITCYRLYERDIPEIPLVVDRYEDRLYIAEFERPHDRSPSEHADWLDLMQRTAGEVMDVHPANIFMKYRERQRGTSQYERRGSAGPAFTVNEGGLKFLVNLSDYIDTGLFLDHRITRGMVRDLAKDKQFLNLFGYTGSFSVYAAAGGARSTVTVDLSNTHIEWAEKNMALNGFSGEAHRLVRDDALSFLASEARAHAGKRPFDLAVVDPPTYSRSKRTRQDWDVQRDHVELLNRLIRLMSPGGIIFFSTNFRRFKLAEGELHGVTVREISRQTVPADFRNRRIHRCWRMGVRSEE